MVYYNSDYFRASARSLEQYKDLYARDAFLRAVCLFYTIRAVVIPRFFGIGLLNAK
jgi:hypothetical protein